MDMLIGGKHMSSDDLENVINPYNNDMIDTIPIAHRQLAQKAIDEANKSKSSLTKLSSFEISNKLFNVVEKLKKNKNEFAELLTLEIGKPINESKVEVNRSIETLKLAAEESKRIYGESVPLDAGLNGEGFFAFTQKLPLGVIVAITPFNYPLNLTIHKIAPAIACKNTVIVKPPTEAPLTIMKFCELLNEEFPNGVINTVTGYGSEIGEYLISSSDVDKISFTGSVTTGLMISQKTGMKKITLELGGNDPLIVLKDANLDKAVEGVVNGAFLNAGQVCMGVKRVIVEEEVCGEFCEKLVIETKKLKKGNPLDKTTSIGTLINEKSAIQIENAVETACESGAKVLTGAKREGAFYSPTVLDNVTPDMDLVKHEIFGPLAPIIRVKSLDEAIEVANNSDYGLQAGVFTSDYESAMRCCSEIETGSVFINKQPTFRTDNMPFGGFKNSGVGKEGIKYAVEEMTKTKLIGFNLR